MDANSIQLIAAIIAIIGALFAAIKWGMRFLGWSWRIISHRSKGIPNKTMKIVPQIHGFKWSEGSSSGKPAMFLHAHLNVTNITRGPIRLLAARIKRPCTDGEILIRHPTDICFGNYPVLPGRTTDVHLEFRVMPPVRKPGENLKAKLFLIDQFGNKHKIRGIVFQGPRPNQPEPKSPELEQIHKICDPVEKEVVAVLKAEINRYKNCGRREGGLGSIATTIHGRTHAGFGTSWREVGSPKNQSINENEDDIDIVSDNAQALLSLYSKLPSEKERDVFCGALLNRIDKTTEYAPVGYLALFVLLQLGKMNDALDKAKADLAGDDGYGFSDLLRVLDGLLDVRHSWFTPDMLDNIERFLEGIKEHQFCITERTAAIRAFRLSRLK
jgi:hypothetical protein